MSAVKYCPQCGTANPEEAEFCKNCGSRFPESVDPGIDEEPAESAPAADDRQVVYGRTAQAPARVKKSNAGVVVAVVLGVLLAIGTGVFVTLTLMNRNAVTRIDPMKNIISSDIIFSGNEGEGVADINQEYLISKIEYDGTDKAVRSFLDSLYFELSQYDSLYNGDQITLTVVYDKEAAETAKVKLTRTSKKVQVTGLEYYDNDMDVDPGDMDEDDSEDDSADDSDDYNNFDDDAEDADDSYIRMRVDTTNAKARGGTKDDHFAAVRTGPGLGKEYKTVGKIKEPHTVNVYNYNDGWYEIATGKWKGFYIHESSLVPAH